MKNLLFTYSLLLLLGISSSATTYSFEDGVFNNFGLTDFTIVDTTDEICEYIQLNSYTNSAVFEITETVFAESPIFTTYLNRTKKFRISAQNRICTGFIHTRKI